ncbi:MAG: enoyl-CoA hydratase/isomerase family protein [Pseudomonadales bacterium]|nr:enoyl-CoA hydratase/isomerase family protein [Pseudomonadales bacterium]
MPELISFEHYLTILESPLMREDRSVFARTPVLYVDWQDYREIDPAITLPPCCVVAVGTRSDSSLADICLATLDEFAGLEANLKSQVHACTTLIQLLRHNERSSIADGLFAESLAYSTLQHSAGFQSWLEGPRRSSKPDTDPLVLTERDANSLKLTLNRPQAHNAYNMALKDALCEVLHAASLDKEIDKLILTGAGPSFCAGGDLSEFGLAEDAAVAHLSRTTRSAGALLANLDCTTEAVVHGACIGAGIEIPAFADSISANRDSYFQLPEISMGLVPGAGGTVSITKKIGRQKTAYLAISNLKLSAQDALAWGLVDQLIED